MFPSLVLAAAIGVPPCWDIFDTAVRHRALAPHPTYVSYNERIFVAEDDQRLVQSTAHVDYRDDGLARVRDERFNYEPIVTRHAEPGPPELGPYGSERDSWLPQRDMLPTIAKVRTQGDMSCTIDGVEAYKGHSTYHLVFSGASDRRPSLKAMWVDTQSKDIWKVIVSGPVLFEDGPQQPLSLASFEVELAYAGPYLVVDHVVWSYRRHEYSQTTRYFGEYTLSDYTFPPALPPSYFGDTAAVVSPCSFRASFTMVGHHGFEPWTSCLSSMRSNQLS